MTNQPSQALLKRHPDLSPAEFSAAWERHGRIAAPWFLRYGVEYYAQIHDIRLTDIGLAQDPQLEIAEWDGAAEVIFTASAEQNEIWSKTDPVYEGYMQNVLRVDERRFLVSEAPMHLRMVEPGAVEGRRVVIITNGKLQVDLPVEAQQEWNKWVNGER